MCSVQVKKLPMKIHRQCLCVEFMQSYKEYYGVTDTSKCVYIMYEKSGGWKWRILVTWENARDKVVLPIYNNLGLACEPMKHWSVTEIICKMHSFSLFLYEKSVSKSSNNSWAKNKGTKACKCPCQCSVQYLWYRKCAYLV